MSYILEALKKSQMEHARGRVPTLDAAPLPIANGHAPARWPLLVSALVAAASVVALGARTLTGNPPAAPAAVVQPAPTPAPVEPVKRERPTVASAPSTPKMAPPVAPEQLPRAAAKEVRVVPAKTSPVPPQSVTLPAFAWHQLPEPVRQATGPLQVNVHVYGDQPARRFVFINGRRYVEGDSLKEGPRLEHIVPTGVVLEYAGDRFRIDVAT